MKAQDIQARIESSLEQATAEVVDLTGTGDHFGASVVAPAFEGKSLIQRHQMVYAPFREELASGELHAFSLKTRTPSEAEGEDI